MNARVTGRRTTDGFAGGPAELPLRLTVRRIRLRSLVRFGLGFGWLVSLPLALAISASATWLLRELWVTLAAWAPWTPWPPGQTVLGVPLPTPELRPRELLHVERLYQILTPLGHQPVLATLLGTVALTALGGLLTTLGLLIAGGAYNAFAGLTGGIEVDLAPREPGPYRARLGPSSETNVAGRFTDRAELDW